MNPTSGQVVSRMALPVAIIGVIILWAGLYLPGLGTLPMKGEEGRRTMPAITMIQSGNWLIPSVGGEAYARKPPLLNWCIALSILATGEANEWSARLPSALSVLVMALGLVLFLRRILGQDVALLATAMYFVNATMIEKGRIAELESLTLTTYGLAFLAWFNGEISGSGFKRWILSGAFLSLSQLTKGPMPTLLFFYLPVVLHLGREKRLRELLSPAHLTGVIITWLPFLIWSRLMFRQLGAEQVSRVWTKELVMRIIPHDFSLGEYLGVLLRGVLNFMPWLLFLPLLWWRAGLERLPETQRRLLTAVRNASLMGFVLVGCLPGARPRYTIQLLIPVFVLLAWTMPLADWSRWLPAWRRLVQGILLVAAAGAIGVAGYLNNGAATWITAVALSGLALALLPLANHLTGVATFGMGVAVATALVLGVVWLGVSGLGDRLPSAERATAREIAGFVPPRQKLCALRPGYERVLVYLGFDVQYAISLETIPTNRPLVLFANQPADLAALRSMPGAIQLPITNHFRGRPFPPFEIWRLEGGWGTNPPPQAGLP